MERSEFYDCDEPPYETRRWVPAVSESLATALCRPPEGHWIIEVWKDFDEYPPYGGSPRPIKRRRCISFKREMA